MMPMKLTDVDIDSGELKLLAEATRQELVSDAEKKKWAKADGSFKVELAEVSDNGLVKLTSTSGTDIDGKKHYVVYVHMRDFKEKYLKDTSDIAKKKKMMKALNGDLAVSCSCNDFQYGGYAYILTQKKALYNRTENREPVIRNPKLKGTVCKHLRLSLHYLPFAVNTMVSMHNKLEEKQ